MKKTILSFIFVIISMAGFSQSLYEYTDLSNYRVKVGELVLNGQKMRPITPLVNQVLMYDGLRWKNQNEKDLIFAADSANIVKYVGNDRDLDMGANSISTDTVKIDGVPLLLNTFKKGNLGGASNIFYSTGASSQPASGTLNQVAANDTTTKKVFYNVSCWGDSFTAQGYPAILDSLLNYYCYNGGVGGETSTQIKNRMIANSSKFGNISVFWVGRNDPFTSVGDINLIKSNIAQMIDSLIAPKRFIVMSVMNGEYGASEYIGGARYNLMIQLNNELAALYPNNYIDIRSYLVSQYNPAIPQDVIDFGHDIPPSSLRSDALHLNLTGYNKVATQVFNFIVTNKMLNNTQLVNGNTLVTDLKSPPWIGKDTPYKATFTKLTGDSIFSNGNIYATGDVRVGIGKKLYLSGTSNQGGDPHSIYSSSNTTYFNEYSPTWKWHNSSPVNTDIMILNYQTGLSLNTNIVTTSNIQSNKYFLNSDLGLHPVSGGQSVVQSYWGLKLQGNTFLIPTNYTPANTGLKDDFCVIVDNPEGRWAKVVLALKSCTNQIGDIIQWRNSSNQSLGAINYLGQFVSLLPTGTAPLVVASTTVVDNLNVEMLDGLHASDFLKYTDKVIQTDTVKVNNDLIVTGEIYNEINHLYAMFYDSTIVTTLTQDVWQQVTNTTKTLYSTAEQDGITILGDTIVFSKAGGYDVYFEFNNVGIDKKEYHYRILQKNGSTVVRSYNKYASTGIQQVRNEKAYIQANAGEKVWCEIMSPSPVPGDVTIQGAKVYAMQRYLEK